MWIQEGRVAVALDDAHPRGSHLEGGACSAQGLASARSLRPSRAHARFRGSDALAVSGAIGSGLAEALKAEARRRVAGAFFGHVAYASLTAAKPIS